jgi:hypothetical protein
MLNRIKPPYIEIEYKLRPIRVVGGRNIVPLKQRDKLKNLARYLIDQKEKIYRLTKQKLDQVRLPMVRPCLKISLMAL